MEDIARQALRMANWSITNFVNMQPENKGGIGMVLPSYYLCYIRSKRFRRVAKPELPYRNTTTLLHGLYPIAKGDQLFDGLSRRHIDLSKEPAQKSGRKRYGCRGHNFRGAPL